MTIERDEAMRTEYHREIEERDRKIAGLMADFAAHEQEIRELKADSCYITNARLKAEIRELEARIEDLNDEKQ
jgi:cell division protein FtsB